MQLLDKAFPLYPFTQIRLLMLTPRSLLLSGLILTTPLMAVYAPIPEQEQGKAWTVALRTGATYDSNIFGAATNEIDSMVYSLSPKLSFNASVTDQTMVSASYQLTLDHFVDRPGDATLDSHELLGRLSHAFTPTTTLDLSDFFESTQNPESLLAGVPVNTDQSYKRNQLDARFASKLTELLAFTLKYRNEMPRYDDLVLRQQLDRTEQLYGIAGSFAVQPKLNLVAEYRRLDVAYRFAGPAKDKRSDYVLGGVDYQMAEKLTLGARLGCEWRHRDGERSQTAPSIELTARYLYAPQSFLAVGFTHALEEVSNTVLYTDEQVDRCFFNIQHTLTAKLVATGSFTYAPAQLKGRRTWHDIDETGTRAGVSLNYLPTKNWMISATGDVDRIVSDDANREQTRTRIGLGAGYTF